MKEVGDSLNASYIVNCVLNASLTYTAIMLNILTIHAIRKTSSLPKPLKTLLLSLAVSDLGVGLLAQPLYIAKMMDRNWFHRDHVWSYPIDIYCSLVLKCCGHKCRQILGRSSSSQISGTCDSQACCCCGDLNLGIGCSLFICSFFEIKTTFLRDYVSYFGVLFHYYCIC